MRHDAERDLGRQGGAGPVGWPGKSKGGWVAGVGGLEAFDDLQGLP